MSRRGYSEPCWCGANDCARCHPSSWWHDDGCDGEDDCECINPGDFFVEP